MSFNYELSGLIISLTSIRRFIPAHKEIFMRINFFTLIAFALLAVSISTPIQSFAHDIKPTAVSKSADDIKEEVEENIVFLRKVPAGWRTMKVCKNFDSKWLCQEFWIPQA